MRGFAVGDFILIFWTIHTSKLDNHWQGLYQISKKITNVTYPVDLGTTGNRFRTFHVNCMRK